MIIAGSDAHMIFSKTARGPTFEHQVYLRVTGPKPETLNANPKPYEAGVDAQIVHPTWYPKLWMTYLCQQDRIPGPLTLVQGLGFGVSGLGFQGSRVGV